MTEPRRTWPTPMSTAGVGEGHTHELPEDLVERVQSLYQRVRRATVINIINLLLVGGMVVFLALFIQNRGVDRDRQNADTNQRINDAICDLLDQLPEGGLLDRPRAKYQCGPGIPLDLLSPEEQAQIGSRTTPTVPAPTSAVPLAPVPPTGSAASPAAPDLVPNKPGTPPDEPTSEPSPDPLVDLGPITEPICARLGVCL